MARAWKIAEVARRFGPIASLVATLGAAALLAGTGRGNVRVSGFAEAQSWSAASLETGRIATLLVETGGEVTAGQVLATLDTATIDAEIAVAEAQKERLLAILPAKEAAQSERLDEEIARLERELLDEEEALATARSEVLVIDSERARVQKSIEGNLATRDELAKLDARLSTVKPVLEQTPRQLDLLRKQLKSTRGRRRDLEAARAVGGTTSAGADLLVAVARIEKLRRQRAETTVRAPAAGRVAAVLHRPGEVVPAGQPIVTLVGARGRVTACVPREHALDLAVGQRATMKPHGDHAGHVTLAGRAITLGPSVEELPVACRKYPSRPAWGRLVTIELDAPAPLVPNQTFEVELDLRSPAAIPAGSSAPAGSTASVTTTAGAAPSGSASAAAIVASAGAGAGAGADAASPSPMRVPEGLRKRSRFEPSGVLWQPAAQRYLLVSDDTGQKDDHDRAPWLFAMDVHGSVEPEPLVIDALAEVDDLESITAGTAGEIYVLSSQSQSKRGHRPPARTLLVKLSERGGRLRAEGEIHLADMIEGSGEGLAVIFDRAEAARDLEIEGMTFHDGALYLGLKGPLDAKGRAAIWRIGDPEALFRTRSLDAAKFSVWAHVALDAEVDGKSVPGGISDLLFAPDGSLVIASTSSRAEGAVESGRLWTVAAPSGGLGGLAPRLVRTFAGHKPEGLSIGATPGRLAVVFDAGSDTPSWMELPWPAP